MSRSLEEQTQSEKQDLVKIITQKKNGCVDKDWSEICSDFDLNISADTLRKAGVGIKLADDACMIGRENAENDLERISNGFVDRQKIRDLTSKVNSIYRSESRNELMRESISSAIKALPEIHPDRIKLCEHDGDRALVQNVADFHYGAKIDVRGLLGETINKYDHAVFQERMDALLAETINIIEKEKIDTVYLFMVGDLIDGMLRTSQLMKLEYGAIESAMRLSEYMAQWILSLSEYAFVNVYAVNGNHSEERPLNSKHREFEDENLEKVIMWYINARLESIDNIFVEPECGRMKLVDVLGYRFLLLHGDGEKKIDNIARDSVNMYQQPVDFFICGHLHKEEERPSGSSDSGDSIIVRTPSICGMDGYANSRGFRSAPGAIAMVIEKGYGRRCVYPIKL